MDLDDATRRREAIPGQAVTISCDSWGSSGPPRRVNRSSRAILFATSLASCTSSVSTLSKKASSALRAVDSKRKAPR